jgi:dipeptidyl aminopeptidase/acylaminoacyl peptidase
MRTAGAGPQTAGSLEDPLEAILASPARTSPQFSACGRHILYVESGSGTRTRTRALRRTAATPGRLAAGEVLAVAPRLSGPLPSPVAGDHRVLYEADATGDERSTIYLLDAETRSSIPVTGPAGSAVHHIGTWLPDASGFTFTTNRREPSRFDIWQADATTGEARPLARNDEPGFVLDPTHAPGRDAVYWILAPGGRNDRLLCARAGSGAPRPVAPWTGAKLRCLRVHRRRGTLLVLTDWMREHMYLAEVDAASGELREVYGPDGDVTSVELSADGGSCFCAVNRHGTSDLVEVDLVSGALRWSWRGTPAVVDAQGMSVSPDGRLALTLERASHPATVCIVDPARASMDVLPDVERGSTLAPSPTPEPVRMRCRDALEVGAWMYRPSPPAARPFPVVVLFHGGPEAEHRPTFSLPVQYFVRLGYGVFAPNVRGSSGFGKTFESLDDLERRLDVLQDIDAAIAHLRADADVDATRLVAFGASYGGYMSLTAAARRPQAWCAAVSICGIPDLVAFLERTSGYRRSFREAEYGSLGRDRALLERLSPRAHAHRIQCPVMLVHGENDARVACAESRELHALLRGRGQVCELLALPGEGHGIEDRASKVAMYRQIAGFLARAGGGVAAIGGACTVIAAMVSTPDVQPVAEPLRAPTATAAVAGATATPPCPSVAASPPAATVLPQPANSAMAPMGANCPCGHMEVDCPPYGRVSFTLAPHGTTVAVACSAPPPTRPPSGGAPGGNAR